jgi:DNA-dependent RNA polymerase auxiliary subunit epsilon
MKERIIKRTLSGYRLNLPKDFRLFVRTRDGVRHELKDDYFGVEYFMRLKVKDILIDFEKD